MVHYCGCEMRKVLFVLLFLLSNRVYSTVDFLVVNHTTKQLYWASTGSPLSYGWIGWEYVSCEQWAEDGKWDEEEKEYFNKGYSFTNNPFLIEEIIMLFLMIFSVGYLVQKRR